MLFLVSFIFFFGGALVVCCILWEDVFWCLPFSNLIIFTYLKKKKKDKTLEEHETYKYFILQDKLHEKQYFLMSRRASRL